MPTRQQWENLLATFKGMALARGKCPQCGADARAPEGIWVFPDIISRIYLIKCALSIECRSCGWKNEMARLTTRRRDCRNRP